MSQRGASIVSAATEDEPVGFREDRVARAYLALLSSRPVAGEDGPLPGLGEDFGGRPLGLPGAAPATRPARSRGEGRHATGRIPVPVSPVRGGAA
jgi:hypothetical protein